MKIYNTIDAAKYITDKYWDQHQVVCTPFAIRYFIREKKLKATRIGYGQRSAYLISKKSLDDFQYKPYSRPTFENKNG